jgi:hypothetical protein
MRASLIFLAFFAATSVSALDDYAPVAQFVPQAVAQPAVVNLKAPCTADCPPEAPPALAWSQAPPPHDGTPYPGIALQDALQDVPVETVPLASVVPAK